MTDQVLGRLLAIEDVAQRALRRKGYRNHLPWCPGSLPKHNCWPECEALRAALATSAGQG